MGYNQLDWDGYKIILFSFLPNCDYSYRIYEESILQAGLTVFIFHLPGFFCAINDLGIRINFRRHGLSTVRVGEMAL